MVLARALLPCALLAQLVAHLFAPAAAHALDPALPLARYAAEVLAPALDGVTVGVRAITQSRDGFLWLATSGGLLRFDGLTFRAPIGRPGLQSDPTLSDVLEDPAGDLWLASDGAGGVGRWRDGDLPAPIEGLPHSFVRELLLARDGALWIATAGGVARREGAALVSFDTDDGLPAVNSRALGEDARGGIWVATTSGVARFDGTRFTPAGPGHAARALLVDRAGDVWVGTQGHGLERLRAGAWTSLGRAEGLPSLTVRTLLEDRAGSLWIGTEAGLVCHRGDALLAFPEGHPAASAPIDELFEDPSGGLWIALGRKGGLVRLRDPAFATLDARAGLPSDDVRAVHEGPDGTLWVATAGGLGRISPATTPNTDRPVVAFDERHGLPATGLVSVAGDARGRAWVVTHSRELFLLEDGHLRRQAPDRAVSSATLDADGAIWITGSGLAEFRPPALRPIPDPLPQQARVLHLGPSGRLWLASETQVILRRRAAFTLVAELPPTPRPFIQALLEDHEGRLWIGTSERGLGRLAPGGREVGILRRQAGIPSERLQQILDDGLGNLWLSTKDGILRVSKEDLEAALTGRLPSPSVLSFTDREGVALDLPGPAQPAAWRGRDARLHFASKRGLLTFDPRRFAGPAPAPQLDLVGVNGAPLRGSTERLAALRGSDQVTLTLTAPVLDRPQRLRLRHRLDGGDFELLGARRELTVGPLEPGAHRLEVEASLGGSEWTAARAPILLTVAPALWQTPPFWAAGALALTAAGLGLHRLRLRRAASRFELVLEERNRIARDVHDTLAQGFVAISGQLEALGRAIDDPAAARERLTRLTEVVDRGIEDARRSVRALRATARDEGPLAAALATVGRAFAGTCAVDVAVAGAPRPLDEDTEEAFFRVGQEAITNAIRHGHAAAVDVRLIFDRALLRGRSRLGLPWLRARLVLEVRDDGGGFDPATPRSGQGLRGMRERAARLGARLEIEGAPGRGTLVRLTSAI